MTRPGAQTLSLRLDFPWSNSVTFLRTDRCERPICNPFAFKSIQTARGVYPPPCQRSKVPLRLFSSLSPTLAFASSLPRAGKDAAANGPSFADPHLPASWCSFSQSATFKPPNLQTVLVPNSFRIRTSKSASKQTTLSSSRINSCERPGGRGVTQSSSVGSVFNTSAALGRFTTGSSLRIFPSRKTSTRFANCAISGS